MSIRKLTVAGLAALIAVGVAFAAHVALSSGQVSSESLVVFQPLETSPLPPGILRAARASARREGIALSAINEAGVSALGSPYRAVLVARRKGTMLLGFAAPDLVTSMRPVAAALSGRRMLVLEGTAGTPTELKQVGISIVVTGAVARVDIKNVDGKVVQVALTKWPHAPYASASISATAKGDFPEIVRAYNSAGVLIAVHATDLRPVHF